MATITVRARSTGTTAYRVSWREGGTRHGAQQSETFSKKVEAERFRAAVELADHRWPPGWTPGLGFVPSPDPAPVTVVVEDTLLVFGQQYVRDLTDAGPDTRHRYLRQLDTLVRELAPIVGGPVIVPTLREEHVRRWVNWRLAQPRGNAPKTIANYHGLLSAICAYAVTRGLRATNRCLGHRLPRRRHTEGEVLEKVSLSEAQFALLADCMFPTRLMLTPASAAASNRQRLPAVARRVHAGTLEDRRLIEVAVGTGLRWSEITAWQVHDLRLDDAVPSASVKRAWKRNPPPGSEFHREGAGPFYLGPPKTPKSRRTITLSTAVVAILRAQVADKQPEDLVFSASMGGARRSSSWYQDRWCHAVRLAIDCRWVDWTANGSEAIENWYGLEVARFTFNVRYVAKGCKIITQYYYTPGGHGNYGWSLQSTTKQIGGVGTTQAVAAGTGHFVFGFYFGSNSYDASCSWTEPGSGAKPIFNCTS